MMLMDNVFEFPIHTGAVIGAARMGERKGFRRFRFSKSFGFNMAVPSYDTFILSK